MEHEVEVYIYDVTKGLARSMSGFILGRQIDGVWHTGVVVYGQEFTFGGMGIMSNPPGTTVLGPPDTVHRAGPTQVPEELFREYLHDLSVSTFRPECYHLFNWNCNTFSNEVCNFLTGQSIPAYITNLPQEVLDSPSGGAIRALMGAVMGEGPDVGGSPMFPTPPTQTTQPPPPQKDSRARPPHRDSAAEGGTAPNAGNSMQKSSASMTSSAVANEKKAVAARLEAPPFVVDRDSSILTAYKEQRGDIVGVFSSQADAPILDEVFEYVSIQDSTPDWGLGPVHVKLLVATIVNERLSADKRLICARLLQAALTREDFARLCAFDRGAHFYRLASAYASLDSRLLATVMKCVCNLLAVPEARSSFLLARSCVSEPEGASGVAGDGLAIALCVHGLVRGEDAPEVCAASARIATAIAGDDSTAMLTEEMALQLGVALIEACQRISDAAAAECAWYALCRCMQVNTEVADIARTMGLDWESAVQRNPSLGKYSTVLREFLFSY